jgi:DNA-binding phage protein
MGKAKTFTGQQSCTKSGLKGSGEPKRPYNPDEELLDEDLVAKGIWECLCANDPEGAMEIIETHLWAKDRAQQARKHGIARTTLYHAFKSRNPTLSTLAKLLHRSSPKKQVCD